MKDRRVQLQVKIQSLAVEATVIHQKERRALVGRRLRQANERVAKLREKCCKQKMSESGTIDPSDREALREAKLEQNKARSLNRRDVPLFWDLRHHRTGLVRDVARTCLLAYLAIKGKPYGASRGGRPGLEEHVDWARTGEPSWDHIREEALKFGPVLDVQNGEKDDAFEIRRQEFRQQLEEWIVAAKAVVAQRQKRDKLGMSAADQAVEALEEVVEVTVSRR